MWTGQYPVLHEVSPSIHQPTCYTIRGNKVLDKKDGTIITTGREDGVGYNTYLFQCGTYAIELFIHVIYNDEVWAGIFYLSSTQAAVQPECVKSKPTLGDQPIVLPPFG